MFANDFSDALGPASALKRLRTAVRHSLLSAMYLLSRPSAKPALRLLYCHHVFDDQKANFARLIDRLQGLGKFIGTSDVLMVIKGEKPITENLLHLSFDDGLKNVISNGLPILASKGVPAAIFVPTEIISTPERFDIHRRLDPNARKMVEHASWKDIERARACGFDVGSHTRTHQRLSEISGSRSALEDEISGSRQEIMRRLGGCDYISLPYGQREDTDSATVRIIKDAGYHACFAAFRGQVVANKTDPFCIPRHHFEPHWPVNHVKLFAYGAGEHRRHETSYSDI